MSNRRVFYACEAISLTPLKYIEGSRSWQAMPSKKPLGVQSVGMTTNFNLEKIFTLGQLAQYDSIENNPEVEVTINKIFDGTLPLYLICMGGGDTQGSLITFANNRVNLEFGIYQDTVQIASQASGVSSMKSTGMYMQSVNFTFPTDGNATEDVTLVGTNREWLSTPTFGFTQEKTAPSVVRRWKFNLDQCILPYGDGGMEADAPVTSVTVSADFNREAIYTLGSYEVYDRPITFPVEVNTEIESLAIAGDGIELDELAYSCAGSDSTSVKNKEIKFVICGKDGGNSFSIDLGKKNKLTSVSYGGGEAGGGNLTITYSFTTDNFLTVEANGTFTTDNGCTLSDTGDKICS
jgi:hypothetical protein